MSQKHKHLKPPPHRNRQLWIFLGGLAVVVIGLGIWLMTKAGPAEPPQVTGGPRLTVNQTLIDEGDVKVNTRVQTTFRLKNVGDQPLYLMSEPRVELVEGC
jgi:mannose-6-phosphate isomerase-like protein (cupin superfamily)